MLEVGTGTGERTLLLAQHCEGMLLTMEADAQQAAAARQRFIDAGCADRISVIVGEPLRFLHKIRGPFDVIVVNTGAVPHDRLGALLAPGGVIVATHATIRVNDMTIAEWLAQAKADAEQRGLPELMPMLEGLAQSTERLRAADWNDAPDKNPAEFAQGRHADDDDQ